MQNQNNKLNYRLVRSERKTLTLKVLPDGTLEVRAPKRLPVSEIEKFIDKKQNWIQKRQQSIVQKEQFEVTPSSWLRYLGVKVPILTIPGGEFGFHHEINFNDSFFTAPTGTSNEALKDGIVGVYKKLAKALITERVAYFAEIIGNHPAKVRINSASTRWGSCSSKGNLNFSWKLIMADGEAIDSVVIHELCHLSHMNHGKAFWRLVYHYCPDYKACKARLDTLSEALAAENW